MALSPLNMDQRQSRMMKRGLERAEESLYEPYIEILEESWEDDRGRKPSPNIKSATANAMHTAKQFNDMVSERLLQHFPQKFQQMLTEDNTSGDVSHFTRYEFEMITAMMPNLTATDLVNVHPMDRRRGQIFFMNVLAGKGVGGEVNEGEALLSTQSGAKGTTHYSDEHVPEEPIGEGDGSTSTYEYFTVEGYVRTGSIEITAQKANGDTMTITDDGGGDLTGDVGTTKDNGDPADNAVVYEDGRLNFTFEDDVANGSSIVVSYDTDFERNKDGIPDMVIALDSIQIRAKTRKLNAKWLVDAMYDLQQAHERDMEDDLLESITSYLTWEIDGEIHADLLRLAKSHGDVYTFEAESSPSVTQNDHNKDFINTVISMANAIKKDTGRGTGNFIVGGMNVSSLIEGLPDTLFDRENDPMDTSVSGPERVGTFANRFAVYQNPYFNDNDFIVGLRGADWRHAGYVYAPYLPMYTTPTLQTADFVEMRRGGATHQRQGCLHRGLEADESQNRQPCAVDSQEVSRAETQEGIQFDGILPDEISPVHCVAGLAHNTHPSGDQPDEEIVQTETKVSGNLVAEGRHDGVLLPMRHGRAIGQSRRVLQQGNRPQ